MMMMVVVMMMMVDYDDSYGLLVLAMTVDIGEHSSLSCHLIVFANYFLDYDHPRSIN